MPVSKFRDLSEKNRKLVDQMRKDGILLDAAEKTIIDQETMITDLRVMNMQYKLLIVGLLQSSPTGYLEISNELIENLDVSKLERLQLHNEHCKDKGAYRYSILERSEEECKDMSTQMDQPQTMDPAIVSQDGQQ